LISKIYKKNSDGNDDLFSLELSSISKIDYHPLKNGCLQEIKEDLALKK